MDDSAGVPLLVGAGSVAEVAAVWVAVAVCCRAGGCVAAGWLVAVVNSLAANTGDIPGST